jgi:uncharacterized metal-binding protein
LKTKKESGVRDQCLCEISEVLLFPCSGASNVGLIADRAARALAAEGTGKMFCLAGIGAHVSGMIASAEAVGRIVAIDGCSIGCAGKTLAHAGLAVAAHVVLGDLGIQKTHDSVIRREQMDRAREAIKFVIIKGDRMTPGKEKAK